MSTCYIPIVVSLLLKLLDELANVDKYFETYAHISLSVQGTASNVITHVSVFP